MRDDLRRAAVRTLGPGPPGPRDRTKVLELLAAPTLDQRAPSHCPRLAGLSRAHSHNVGSCAPAPAEPNARPPAR
eukprot:9170759-Alexandrium_andersonii.AAC.1